MKKFTKLLGIVLIIALVMSMGASAFATITNIATPDDGFTVTVTKDASDKATHSYEAYKIFAGTLANDDKGTGATTDDELILSNITWGGGVDSTKYGDLANALNALRSTANPEFDELTATSTAASFAQAISKLNAGNDTEKAQAIAAAIGSVLSDATAGTAGANGVSGLQPGYYLIKDADNPTGTDGAQTRFILQVVQSVTVKEKASVPSVEKKVDDKIDSAASEDTINWQDSADYDIGDKVPYKLTGTLPSTFADYDWYYYEFTDTMSAGLTYNDDVKIYVSIPTYDADGNKTGETWYDMTEEFTSSWADQVLTIKDDITVAANGTVSDAGLKAPKSGKVVNNYADTMTQTELDQATADSSTTDLRLTKDSKVVVRYTATLNSNAKLGSVGNDNKVKLIYSNNPNKGGSGDKGNTPEDVNIVFVYQLIIDKIDGTDTKVYKFPDEVTQDMIDSGRYVGVFDEDGSLTGYKEMKYLKGADFELYKIIDPNYTIPTTITETAMEQAVTDKKAVKIATTGENVPIKTVTSNTGETGTGTNGSKFTFNGLDAGKYILVETATPAGYNSVSPMIIEVTAKHTNDSDTTSPLQLTELKGTLNNGSSTVNLKTGTIDYSGTKSSNATLSGNVENNSGTVLPSTGGVGTTIFYVVGSILVVAAGVLLITKKRMSREG